LKKLLAFLFLIALVCAGYVAYGLLRPIGGQPQKSVLLKPGSSARHIAQQLKAEGVIPSWPAFLALYYWKAKPMKAGEYLFDRPANALEVYDRLARGDISAHAVVIPEGDNMFEIAAALEAAGLCSQQDFLNVARDPALIADLDPQAHSLEGYLFPDTYEFTRTQNAHDMAAAMVHRFRQEARKIGLTADVHRVVTMASIVEKETAAAEERPLVASVYYNRLARNMALDADPTVIYAALLDGRYRGAIYESDLANRSPYNTYKVPGLPPGPIANPGEASLAAAIHPAQSDYLYFVSDNNGHHRFAATMAEHERNVIAYRRAAAAH
jgi:UPF0755 protein